MWLALALPLLRLSVLDSAVCDTEKASGGGMASPRVTRSTTADSSACSSRDTLTVSPYHD